MNVLRLILGGLVIVLAAAPSLAASPILAQTQDGQQPQAAAGPDGKVHLVYGTTAGSIYWSVSRNGGDFAPPRKVAQLDEPSFGAGRGPRIAVARSALVVAAVDKTGSLISWRSEDGGEHWTQAATITDLPGAAREGEFNIAAGPNDRLFAAWLDSRKEGPQIYGAASADGGKTWGANVLVYQSPDGHVCDCCYPSIAFDSQGQVHVMFRNWLAGNRDMHLTTSADGGKTFGPAQKLGNGVWHHDECPMDGGSVTVTGKGEVLTAWRRAQVVYFARPGQKETRVGDGVRPSIAALGDKYWIAWTFGGAIQLRNPDGTITKLGDGPYVTLAGPPTGPLFAFWQSPNGIATLRVDK